VFLNVVAKYCFSQLSVLECFQVITDKLQEKNGIIINV